MHGIAAAAASTKRRHFVLIEVLADCIGFVMLALAIAGSLYALLAAAVLPPS